MLLTVITVLVLATNRLVVISAVNNNLVATTYYPGSSCEDIYIMNPESRDKSGYYWIFGHDGRSDIYCRMKITIM